MFALIGFTSLMLVAGVCLWSLEKLGWSNHIVEWVEKL